MKDFWSQQSIKWYRKACDTLNYPKIPLGSYFEKIVHSDDTVLDIGCGIGSASLYLAERCKKVVALDPSQNAIQSLRETIEYNNIKNIDTIFGNFPLVKPEACDITVILYVNKLINDLQSAKDVYSVTKREGIILCNYSSNTSDFQTEIYKRLGLNSVIDKCRNGCFIAGLLESLGSKIQCEKITHDFGQPLDNFEDACEFLLKFFRLNKEHLPLVKEMAPDYIIKRYGGLYLENIRNSCLIHFKKTK
jgi:ubiquinone/menaquinone biosynthesis C-methylase UbiE